MKLEICLFSGLFSVLRIKTRLDIKMLSSLRFTLSDTIHYVNE